MCPVTANSGLSTRVFEIFAAGGIPIVPESARIYPQIREIGADDILFYNVHDIMSPHSLVERGNALFDKDGAAGIARRFLIGWRHHSDVRLDEALKTAADLFGFGPIL